MPETIQIPADLRPLSRRQLDDLRKRLGESKRLKRCAAINGGEQIHAKPFVASVATENAGLTRIAWEEWEREETAFQRRQDRRAARALVTE